MTEKDLYHSPTPKTTMSILLWDGATNGSLPVNETQINYTMHEKEYNTLCPVDDSTNSSSVCNSGGLGLSLSTPILMLSCGVLGNMIALAVLYTARKEMKSMVFYTLLFALAITDLVGQLLTGPIAIIVYANNLQWVGGEPVCKYHAFCMIFFGMITPLFVCLMSFERLLALRFTYYHARVVTRKKARIAVLICWISVSLFCSLPFMGFGSYEHQFPGSWCFLNFHKESQTDIAYAYTYAVLNITFIITIIVCNTAVMLTLVKMRKTRVLNNSPSLERRQGVKPKTKKFEEETQMVWFLCAITIVFSTCYLPLNINILINQITGRVNYAADLIGVRMASINQILDPWLYILLRKRVIVKVVLYLINLALCRRTVSAKRSQCFLSTSEGKNYSFNSFGDRNYCRELNHFDNETVTREYTNKLTNTTVGLRRASSQSDQGLADSLSNSTKSLMNEEHDINMSKRRTLIRRSWSLDGALKHCGFWSNTGQEQANQSQHHRKSSLQSFIQMLRLKTTNRRMYSARFKSVGNYSV